MSSSFGNLDRNFQCPYCWEEQGFSLEEPPQSTEHMHVDCANCCRPISLKITPSNDGYELIAER